MFQAGFLSTIPPTSSQQYLYDICLLLSVQYWTPDDGQETCPKHVEFYSKNKEKLVYLVGFIIRISARPMPLHAEKHQGAALDRPVGKLRRTAITSVVTVSLI